MLKEYNAFNVSSFVLRAMMSGQYWPEGDEVYHAELTVPVLLVHGMHDKFVPVEEDQRMAEVRTDQDSGYRDQTANLVEVEFLVWVKKKNKNKVRKCLNQSNLYEYPRGRQSLSRPISLKKTK